MKGSKSVSRVLEYLLKDFTSRPTVTSLAKEIGLSRVGAWKLIKRMQSGKLIVLYKIGNGETNAYSMGLNWENPLVCKNLALCLTENALKNQRWLNIFAELGNKLDFLVLYGSIINSPREANDIDVLGVVYNKSRFVEIEESIRNIQKTQSKKIHAINFTQAELRRELRKPNMAFIGAIKKGIVLFGQEKFIRFMESVARK
ncbi:hypothetical protein HYU15_00385 [Candidatus Woesearchaeota archaeon]|nr:hypothetical protein [Candidatus Woesearchaeota archaeon]